MTRVLSILLKLLTPARGFWLRRHWLKCDGLFTHFIASLGTAQLSIFAFIIAQTIGILVVCADSELSWRLRTVFYHHSRTGRLRIRAVIQFWVFANSVTSVWTAELTPFTRRVIKTVCVWVEHTNAKRVIGRAATLAFLSGYWNIHIKILHFTTLENLNLLCIYIFSVIFNFDVPPLQTNIAANKTTATAGFISIFLLNDGASTYLLTGMRYLLLFGEENLDWMDNSTYYSIIYSVLKISCAL